MPSSMISPSNTEGSSSTVPALPLHNRVVIWGALGAITAISWLYLVRMPMTPRDLGSIGVLLTATMSPHWAEVWLIFMMWAVMMVAMMVPSASPMIETYARIARSRSGASAYNLWLFAAAYIVVWALFSAAATAGQIALQRAALITSGFATTPLMGGIILASAGIYQLTPLKQACLGHCRSPIGFFMMEWRDGAAGAFKMGLKHGAFCVGCCWALMALLFVLGVMNLLWVAAISVFVLLEKATPYGRAIARVTGVAMLVCGIALPLAARY
jgi:predicted metal-binding membrane protein